MEAHDLYFDCANWLRMALSRNDELKDAHYLFGVLYEKGYSVDLNMKKAFECFKRASELGHGKAHTKLGHCYYSGIRKPSLMADSSRMSLNTTMDSLNDDEPQFIVAPNRTLAKQHYMHAGKLFNDSEAANCAGLIIEQESGPVSAVEWY
jgi:TPR repeat protein